LGESGDKQRSLEVNDRVLQQHGASSDPETLVQVAWASNNKAVDLTALGRMSEALATYQALTERFPPEPRFVPVLAKAWMNWAVDLLDELGMHDEEKALYDRIQALLIENRDRSLDEYLAWAFVNKGIQLDEDHQYEQAIELFDVVIRRWWASMSVETSMSMHEALAAAWRHRCRALTFLKRYDEVIKGAQPVVERYHRTRDVGIDEQVAWTLLNQAFAERQLGLVADARRTDGLLLKRYAASPSEEARLVADNCRRLELSDPIGPEKPPDSG